MAFCPNCGKEVKDGEVCSCQTTNQSAKAKAAMNVDVNAMATGFVGTVKEIVANPTEGVKKFVDGVSWMMMGVIAVIYAFISVITGIVDKIVANIKANADRREMYEEIADDLDMDFEDYVDDFDIDLDATIYELSDIVKGGFYDIIEIAIGISLMAVVVFFAVKIISKINMTWKQAFAISVIDLIIFVPLYIVTEILGILPDFRLLSWIISAIITVRSWGGTIIEYIALKSVCGDTKSTVYAGIPAKAAYSLLYAFATFLVYSLFNL